jgi:hypothetical protein
VSGHSSIVDQVTSHRPSDPWPPSTEDQLLLAASTGALEETHHLDIKSEIGGGRRANRDAAQDMAALAIDGGLLIYGVDETTTPPSLKPVPLRGVPERLEQVALSAITEPLRVRTKAIPSGADPSLGYVIVEVPPSGAAPHMVDGRYYGRGDKTNIVLADAQVIALHDRRRESLKDMGEVALDALRDFPLDSSHGTVVICARPQVATDALRSTLEALFDADEWNARLLLLAHQIAPQELSYSPSIRYATAPERRPRGRALTSGLEPGRALPSLLTEDTIRQIVEVTIGEDGDVVFGSARAVERASQPKLIRDHLIVGNTEHVVALALAISQMTGYVGSWNLAIAAGGLNGGQSAALHVLDSWGDRHPVYSEDLYVQPATATFEELRDAPHTVANRLVRPLLRAIGSENLRQFQHLTT